MSSETGQILGEISEDEFTNGRPMLSAIAVTSKGQPGSGFFGLAKLLGKLEDDSEESKQQFWKAEKANVYATWQKELKRER
jgi:hypothetical protein